MKTSKKEMFSIPNILCYFRILLIPLFMVIFTTGTVIKDYYIAAGIILLAGFTDLIDGYIARKFNQVTELGKFLDPLADKLMQAAMIISLMFKIRGVITLVIIFVVKESFMIIAGGILLKKGKKLDGAMWFGKVSTAVFYVTMFLIIAVPTMSLKIVNLLIIIAAFFLVLSFALYIPVFKKMYQETKN